MAFEVVTKSPEADLDLLRIGSILEGELPDLTEPEWKQVANRAIEERLGPLVLTRIRENPTVPETVSNQLRSAYYNTSALNLLIYRELARLLKLSTNQTLAPPILLKGGALASSLYESIALRPMCDLDLLVRPEDLEGFLEVARELGYRRLSPEMAPGLSAATHYQIALRGGPANTVLIEFHWSLVGGHSDLRAPNLGWFFEQTESWSPPSELADTTCSAARQLTPTALLLYLSAQVWSWNITKLRGPVKWTYFYLYVILDIFSRYVTGWMLARRESAELARRLISESCLKQNIEADQLTIHADRGSSMRSKSVALLLADLGITKTHSRPYVSNDNPYSESQFKTMKYCPEFPSRFGCLEDGRLFCGGFFDYYNNAHRHSGLGLMTPAAVHYGRADELNAARRQVLLEAHRVHPERFVHGTPQPPVLPRQVWINPPPEKTTPQEALGATFSGRPIPELPPDSSYPDAIASEPNRDRTALTPRPSLIEAH